MRQTSIDVYRKNMASLGKRKAEVYKAVFDHGPVTSNEAFEFTPLKGLPGYRHNTNARMTELEKEGAVQDVGTKICSISGEKATLWDITGRVAVKPDRPKTKDQIITDLKIQIDTLFNTIKHGDEEHQNWLKNKIEEHFNAGR